MSLSRPPQVECPPSRRPPAIQGTILPKLCRERLTELLPIFQFFIFPLCLPPTPNSFQTARPNKGFLGPRIWKYCSLNGRWPPAGWALYLWRPRQTHLKPCPSEGPPGFSKSDITWRQERNKAFPSSSRAQPLL